MELPEYCSDLTCLKSPKDFTDGLALLVDKPLDWTSFDVVKKIRSGLQHKFKIKKIKVGHAGTLDPLATGLVIVCTGKATRRINEFMGAEKVYEAKIKFGATTPSFDLETEVDHEFPVEHIRAEKIEETLKQFLGEQPQIPPLYSVINFEQQPAYEMIRKGETFDIESRNVVFHELHLKHYSNHEATVYIRCSKGTYVRSFARDLGTALESGGYLTGLRRTAIGTLSVDKAKTMNEIDEALEVLQERWISEELV